MGSVFVRQVGHITSGHGVVSGRVGQVGQVVVVGHFTSG